MNTIEFNVRNFLFEGCSWLISGEIEYDGERYFGVKAKTISVYFDSKKFELYSCLDADFIEKLEDALYSKLLECMIKQHDWEDAL